MYSLALYILERESDAQDVVHEVFLHVRREAGRDEASNGIVGAWLLMLTRNGAVDRLRSYEPSRTSTAPAIAQYGAALPRRSKIRRPK